jgi:hypothetical protein
MQDLTPQVMNGSFVVTDAPDAPPPPPPPPPVTRLAASVSASGAVRLNRASVHSGRARIVVVDRSKTADFHLVGKGVNKRTGMRFRGTARWSVRLSPGTYRYGNDRKARTKTLHVQ